MSTEKLLADLKRDIDRRIWEAVYDGLSNEQIHDAIEDEMLSMRYVSREAMEAAEGVFGKTE